MSSSAIRVVGELGDRRAIDAKPPGDVGAAEREVVGDRRVEHEPAVLAILGDVREPGVEPRARRRRARRRDRRRWTSPACAHEPGDRERELALAVAVDAGDADDLAGAHREVDRAERAGRR